MTWTAFLVAVVLGLAFAEWTDVAPWFADKLVRRAARMIYAKKPDRAEIRAEEWAAVIEDRPGKVLKLVSALGYVLAAILKSVRRSQRVRSYAHFALLHTVAYGIAEAVAFLQVLEDWTGRKRAIVAGVSVSLAPLVACLVALVLCLAALDSAPTWRDLPEVALGVVMAFPFAVVLRFYHSGATAIALTVCVPRGNQEYRSKLIWARARHARDIMEHKFPGLV